MNKKLTIGICTLDERSDLFCDLFRCLLSQGEDALVEILVEKDNRQRTTGAKRNAILDRADGEYVCFVDDDDDVHKSYVEFILDAAKAGTSCIGIVGAFFNCGAYDGLFQHSIRHAEWRDNVPGRFKYLRCPNHLNPVKLSIIRENSIRFPEVTIGEDRAYSAQLRPHLITEVMIEKPIYVYNYGKPNA